MLEKIWNKKLKYEEDECWWKRVKNISVLKVSKKLRKIVTDVFFVWKAQSNKISFKRLITRKPNKNLFHYASFLFKVKNIQHLSFVFSNSNCTYNFPQKLILFTQQATNIYLLNFLNQFSFEEKLCQLIIK